MLPIFCIVLAIMILLITGFYISSSRKNFKKELLREKVQNDMTNKLTIVEEQLNGLEKRLTNVEMIVTDSKFTENSGREAINLKSELTELKSIIKNLKK